MYCSQTIYAIQKSGFSSSEQALFFNYVSLSRKNTAELQKSFSSIVNYDFEPFHPNLIFYDLYSNSKYAVCYFCEPTFGKLSPLANMSLQNTQRNILALNSNGYGRVVQMDLIMYNLIQTILSFLPVDLCVNTLSSYKNSLKTLLNGVTNCNRKIFLPYASMQGNLNVTFVFEEQYDSAGHQNDKNWHLQIQVTVKAALDILPIN